MIKAYKILETLYLPEHGKVAMICDGGRILLQWHPGSWMQRHQIHKPEVEGFESRALREKLEMIFDSLEVRYQLEHGGILEDREITLGR